MYTENDLVAIAKRENNNKRKYLVVNRLQGKHIPVSPAKALGLFAALGEQIKQEYAGERLLVVGFAETATAIGAALAVHTDSYYMQTTREQIEHVSYLYFTESHSHATEQKLVREDLDAVLGKIDRIVFAEDEVTTGNTILKIIHIIRKEFQKQVDFSVASILNGMNREAETVYEKEGICLHYLVKTNHDSYTEIAEKYRGDGICHGAGCKGEVLQKGQVFESACIKNYQNSRRLVSGTEYENSCVKLWNWMKEMCGDAEMKGQSILVLGTEEFMYPALAAAAQMERLGAEVKFHATTRSPIAVSSEAEYPVHERFELRSFYDKDRVTYIYELKKYDRVFIITDAVRKSGEGKLSLIQALQSVGNTDIHIVRWCAE